LATSLTASARARARFRAHPMMSSLSGPSGEAARASSVGVASERLRTGLNLCGLPADKSG
jgi:hypothetical protein